MVENPITQRVALSPDGTPHLLLVTNQRAFQSGGVEQKVQLTSTNGKSYIERPYNAAFIASWLRFQQAGLPIPPELFIDSSHNSLVVTDLKQDGSEIYGKGFERCLRGVNNYQFDRRHPEIDTQFLAITEPEGFQVIRNKVRAITNIATENSIMLPEDDPCELLVHPNGSHELVTLDLSGAAITREQQQETGMEVSEVNEMVGNYFLSNLQKIRTRLLLQQS